MNETEQTTKSKKKQIPYEQRRKYFLEYYRKRSEGKVQYRRGYYQTELARAEVQAHE